MRNARRGTDLPTTNPDAACCDGAGRELPHRAEPAVGRCECGRERRHDAVAPSVCVDGAGLLAAGSGCGDQGRGGEVGVAIVAQRLVEHGARVEDG